MGRGDKTNVVSGNVYDKYGTRKPVVRFLSGLGLREYVASLAVTRAGVDPEIGPALSLIWFAAVTLIPGLLGLSLRQLGRSRRRKE